MKKNGLNQQKHCPSCGAPVVSEICAYCGTATGLNTADADMEYDVLECKEATLSFWTVGFPMIFAAAFGMAGIMVVLLSVMLTQSVLMLLISAPFLLIGIVAFSIVMRTIMRYLKVKKHGQMIKATVYGYMDAGVLINDLPAQIVKLLVQTREGPRFILYELGNTLKPYGINDSIDIMVYQNYFMICKNKEIARW